MKSNEKFYPWHCYGIPLYYIRDGHSLSLVIRDFVESKGKSNTNGFPTITSHMKVYETCKDNPSMNS